MMVDEGFALMKERGFKSKQVIREKYPFARQERKASDLKMSGADRALLQAKMARYQAVPDSRLMGRTLLIKARSASARARK